MRTFAYLRHPVVLLASVSAAILFVWYLLGQPVNLPPSPLAPGEKFACVAYAPEEAGMPQAPIPFERIEADLAALTLHAACVRTFRTGLGLDRVPEAAARHGMTVLQGVALGGNETENEAEIERAETIAKVHRLAIRAFIAGSGALERRALRASELSALVRDLRSRTKIPVASAENAGTWDEAELLAAAVDFIVLRVPLYEATLPVSADDAARQILEERARISARYPGKPVAFVEAGWPSEGRMRVSALPSPSNQARVLHAAVAASKQAKFQLSVFEGLDLPARAHQMGTAGAHWGILTEAHAAKFRFGNPVLDHPLWRTQAAISLMFALVVFAAGYLAARSAGPDTPGTVAWEPVALIALGGGALTGWAMALLPVQSHTPAGWVANSLLLLLAIAVPPLAAAAYVRRARFGAFSALFNRQVRRSLNLLDRAMAAALSLLLFAALVVGLVLAIDPAARDFPFAALTGPALSVLILANFNPLIGRRESVAEPGTALLLAVSATLILFNESFWNWQASWLAATLTVLAFVSWRAGAQTRS